MGGECQFAPDNQQFFRVRTSIKPWERYATLTLLTEKIRDIASDVFFSKDPYPEKPFSVLKLKDFTVSNATPVGVYQPGIGINQLETYPQDMASHEQDEPSPEHEDDNQDIYNAPCPCDGKRTCQFAASCIEPPTTDSDYCSIHVHVVSKAYTEWLLASPRCTKDVQIPRQENFAFHIPKAENLHLFRALRSLLKRKKPLMTDAGFATLEQGVACPILTERQRCHDRRGNHHDKHRSQLSGPG